MMILVLNAGSSSLKYSLFDRLDQQCLIDGVIEKLDETPENDHAYALQKIDQILRSEGFNQGLATCHAVGHRVVHGGEIFYRPTLINREVIDTIEELATLAPLHNPVNLLPIRYLAQHYPKLEQVAVFDTAFHHTLPDYAYRYALPNALYDQYQIRRYGFHGISHQYISKQMAELLDKPVEQINLIIMHLGNGASVCAVEDGESMDTSMGFTPLEGLVMGSRSGDLDPAIPVYLIRQLGYSANEVDQLLNKRSGLVGLCQHNDMRDIIQLAEQGELTAQLALDLFIYRLIKQVGSYLAILDEVDALVFTGGIGEHSALIREEVLTGFSQFFGIEVDFEANDRLEGAGIITTRASLMAAWVLPTDEAFEIADQTEALLREEN